MFNVRLRPAEVIAIALGSCLFGCSSPPEEAVCPALSSCGGVLSGRWDAVQFCVGGDPEDPKNESLGTPECQNFYASISFEHVVSTLEFVPGKSVAGTIDYLSTSEVQLTNDCSLALFGSDVTPEVCVALTERLVTQGWEQTLQCSGSSICYCSGKVDHNGATIIFDEANGTILGEAGEPIEYCVEGDSMRVLDRSQGVDVFVTYQRVG